MYAAFRSLTFVRSNAEARFGGIISWAVNLVRFGWILNVDWLSSTEILNGSGVNSSSDSVRSDSLDVELEVSRTGQIFYNLTFCFLSSSLKRRWISFCDLASFRFSFSANSVSTPPIDYIAIEKKWKGTIRNCKAYPGADCDTDYLLVTKIKLNKAKREQPKEAKSWNLEEFMPRKQKYIQ